MKKNGMTLSGARCKQSVDQTSCPRETVNQKYDIKHTNRLFNLLDNGYYNNYHVQVWKQKKAACMCQQF